jgi:hypothetical protein
LKLLERRGLQVSKKILWATDGGKGIINTLQERFGKKLISQRYTILKIATPETSGQGVLKGSPQAVQNGSGTSQIERCKAGDPGVRDVGETNQSIGRRRSCKRPSKRSLCFITSKCLHC